MRLLETRGMTTLLNHGHEHDSGDTTYSKQHLALMALFCLIPIAILVAVVYVGVESTYLLLILVLLCPLFMLLMHLPRMLARKKRTEETQNETNHKIRIGSREQRLGEVGT